MTVSEELQRAPKFLSYPAIENRLTYEGAGEHLGQVHCQPRRSARFDIEEGYVWTEYPRPFQQFFFLVKGSGEYRLGKERDKFVSGDMVFVPTYSDFNFDLEPGPSKLIVTSFYISIYGVIPYLEMLGFPRKINLAKGGVEERCFETLAHECSVRQVGWELSFGAAGTELFVSLLRHYGDLVNFSDSQMRLEQLQRLQPCFNHIRQNYSREISMNDLASLLGLQEVRFRQIFKQATGMTPVHFIQDFRVNRATHELLTSSKSVGQIAKQVGFQYTSFFNRIFQKKFRCSPLQYRKNGLKAPQRMETTASFE